MTTIEELTMISKNINILFVDDDPNFLNETSEVFKSIFNSVTLASNAKEALEKYSPQIDLIITDLNMPYMNGIELIKEIKKVNFQQHIIVLSAYNDAENLFSVIDNGASGFIVKPLNETQMINTLYNISRQINFKNIYEQHLLQQTKLADLGSMIDIIAHQWLNPLSIMQMRINLLDSPKHQEFVSLEEIQKFSREQNNDIHHLVETLNEFRDFLKEKDIKDHVQLQSIINSVLILLKDFIISHTLVLKLECDESIFVNLYKNEFKHVLITLITNAIEAFEESDIDNKKITIKTYTEDNHTYIIIKDNAGGIKSEHLDLIFNKNFTTKTNGTGVGLHLTKKILEKINGTIDVSNTIDGASFKIMIPNI